jgi:leucyl/phenylalanyl-tRNA--protein transferase
MNPSIVLAAYRRGIFPWPVSPRVVPWVSPDPRAVLPLDGELHWSRSLRRTMRSPQFSVTHDAAFAQLIRECGRRRRDGTWITNDVIDTYTKLHELGWAHSVEVWSDDDGSLAGGIYGVAIGAMFAGESMFHRRTDGSKVAFAHLAERLQRNGYRLFDVQVLTEHLASLGCVSIERKEFLRRLDAAVTAVAKFGD